MMIQDVVAQVLASLTQRVGVGAASSGMAKKWPCQNWTHSQTIHPPLKANRGRPRSEGLEQGPQFHLPVARMGAFKGQLFGCTKIDCLNQPKP